LIKKARCGSGLWSFVKLTGCVVQKSNLPKRQHFVAQMHLKNFLEGGVKLWVHNKVSRNTFSAAVDNIFFEKHLYTEVHFDGNKDTRLESEFADLECAARPIMEKIISSVRNKSKVLLLKEERLIWDRYFYMQWRRVPDAHARVALLENPNNFLDEFFSNARARGGEAAAQADALDTPEQRKRLVQGGKVRALKKKPGTILCILAARGLNLLHITAPGERFIIGSFPIVRQGGHLKSASSSAWLPIAWDIAVGPAGKAGAVAVTPVSDPIEIFRINKKIANGSTMFASSSKDLIDKLVGE